MLRTISEKARPSGCLEEWVGLGQGGAGLGSGGEDITLHQTSRVSSSGSAGMEKGLACLGRGKKTSNWAQMF